MNRTFTSIVRIALFVALLAVPTFAMADDMPWVEWDETTKTLTFHYDSNYESCSNAKYTLNSGTEDPEWILIGYSDDESSASADETEDDTYEDYNGPETVVFDSSFANARPTTCYEWFMGMIKLKKIEGIEYLNTSEVTNMANMFDGALIIPSIDLKHLDTSKVTDMSNMFEECCEVRSLDLSCFDTKNVTNMSCMFYGCDSLETIDFSNVNVEKVTDMTHMFEYCRNIKSLDLSMLNTCSVTNMKNMFCAMDRIKSIDLSNFNTSSVTNMELMFAYCPALTELDLSAFDTRNVRSIGNMFLNSPLEVIYVGEGFDMSKATGSYVFGNCKFPNYDESKLEASMANYTDGYLTLRRHFTVGDRQYNADGLDAVCKDQVEINDTEVLSSDFTFTFSGEGSAVYLREVSSAWSTLCLPFAFEASKQDGNVKYYEVSEVGSDIIKVNEITGEVEAGKPVLVYTSDKRFIVQGKEDTQIELQPVADSYMVGTFAETTVDATDGNYIIAKNKFWDVTSLLNTSDAKGVKLPPYRAYIHTSESSTKAVSLDIVTDETNGISDINADGIDNILNGADFYDMQGRKLTLPTKGMMIIKKGNVTRKILFQ